MKKYLHYLLIAGPAILVVAIFFVKDTSALTDVRISPPSPDRTICTYTNGTDQVTAGCDEAETTRIACPSSDVLCGYEGGWKMCVPRDFQRTINELCTDYTVTIAGNPAPVVSVDGSPNVDQRSYCPSTPNEKKEVCTGYANAYIACYGENDKICRRTDEYTDRSLGTYYSYGCVQTSNCTDVMGKFVTATDITSSARWAKFASNGAPAAGNDGICKKTHIVNEAGASSAGVKTYATKQECESASTVTTVSRDDTCTADVWSCGSWSACSAEKTQTRTCSLTYDCKNTDQPSKPAESKSCTVTEPKSEPEPKSDLKSDPNQCPRKPDSAKGTGEPTALPAGTEIKQVPSYYIWGCYSQPDKTSNSECTAQAAKRTGNITSPCVFGQESIVCPSKGTAYKEGNFLKCAPVKLPKNEEGNPTTVITQTVERIVTVEVPSTTSIVPPEVVTDESCKTYKEEVDEKVVSQGDAFLNAADAAFKSTAVNNPAFKKVFYDMLKESAKKSRKLQKLVNAKTCNAETVSELHSTVKDFEAGELEKVKQTLAFLDKETKVQNQYVGINEDFKWVEKFAKSLKPGSAQATLFVEELGTFEQMRIDFQDILDAEKEGKVFGFEVETIAQQASELRKNIEKKTSLISGDNKNTSVKKGSTGSKKLSKKSKKSAKKTTKKSSKKKSTKKSTKKTTKKNKS